MYTSDGLSQVLRRIRCGVCVCMYVSVCVYICICVCIRIHIIYMICVYRHIHIFSELGYKTYMNTTPTHTHLYTTTDATLSNAHKITTYIHTYTQPRDNVTQTHNIHTHIHSAILQPRTGHRHLLLRAGNRFLGRPFIQPGEAQECRSHAC
jgi:hypothetical protein